MKGEFGSSAGTGCSPLLENQVAAEADQACPRGAALEGRSERLGAPAGGGEQRAPGAAAGPALTDHGSGSGEWRATARRVAENPAERGSEADPATACGEPRRPRAAARALRCPPPLAQAPGWAEGARTWGVEALD